MPRAIVYTHRARKARKTLPPVIRQRIDKALQVYAEAPALARNVKKLRGRPELRLRVGDWRVLFVDDGHVVTVVAIGHRREIYD